MVDRHVYATQNTYVRSLPNSALALKNESEDSEVKYVESPKENKNWLLLKWAEHKRRNKVSASVHQDQIKKAGYSGKALDKEVKKLTKWVPPELMNPDTFLYEKIIDAICFGELPLDYAEEQRDHIWELHQEAYKTRTLQTKLKDTDPLPALLK